MRVNFHLFGVLLLAFSLASCANDNSSDQPSFSLFGDSSKDVKPAAPPERVYNEGLALLEQKKWKAAAKKFEQVDKDQPYSEWAKKSLLMMAYAYHQAEDYDSAAAAAERYIALHPGADDIAYAKFLMGDSYYNTIPDVARDQQRSEKSLTIFQDLQQHYAGTPYAKQAQERIQMARDQLAGKEMDVGRFYLKQKSYLAAINRFRVVVEQYQNTRHIEEALYRLTEAYMALGIVNEAQTAAAVLGHNFPDSQWYHDAYALLQSGGTAPQEAGDSWIARAFKHITG